MEPNPDPTHSYHLYPSCTPNNPPCAFSTWSHLKPNFVHNDVIQDDVIEPRLCYKNWALLCDKRTLQFESYEDFSLSVHVSTNELFPNT
jgi:hypothetical protein